MKPLLYILVAQCFLTTSALAQGGSIDSFAIVPSNPTYTDTVRVFAYCRFNYTGCQLQSSAVNQLSLEATASHCIGMMTAICHRTDTFTLIPRPGGTYQFKLSLYTTGSPNCDLSVLSDEDSITFTVIGGPASVNPANSSQGSINAFYSSGQLIVHGLSSSFAQYDIRIVSAAGQLVYQKKSCQKGEAIPLSLSAGLYIITVSNNQLRLTTKLAVD